MPAILVIENDDLEMEFIRSIIQQELGRKYALLAARTGAQGLRFARQNHPEIVLMDVLLPDMDGIDVIREMRRFLTDSCISILTACTDFYCAQKAIGLRVFAYLLKPIKPGDLKSSLEQMVVRTSRQGHAKSGSGMSASLLQAPAEARPPLIEESLQYIRAHFEEKLSLEDVAKRFYINAQYFSRVFKRETGITFTEYIASLRIQAACNLLTATNYPAYRIANECGFSDPSYFNRVFLRYMEMTPQKYRRLHQERQEEAGGEST